MSCKFNNLSYHTFQKACRDYQLKNIQYFTLSPQLSSKMLAERRAAVSDISLEGVEPPSVCEMLQKVVHAAENLTLIGEFDQIQHAIHLFYWS